jgi:hypothetical protein
MKKGGVKKGRKEWREKRSDERKRESGNAESKEGRMNN